MAKQTVNVGSNPNDDGGDELRSAFIKINENFDELYADNKTDLSEFNDANNILVLRPYFQATNEAILYPNTYDGVGVEYYAANNSANTDEIAISLTLARDTDGYFYNEAVEASANTVDSPAGTLWNIDGWENLKDVHLRKYSTFNSLFEYDPPSIIDKDVVMKDVANDKYYTMKFDLWNDTSAGAGFSYFRRKLDTSYFFSSATSNTDVISDQIEIDMSSGYLFNVLSEVTANTSISPLGSLWNIEGWKDLSNLTAREYSPLYEIVDLTEMLNYEFVMQDTVNEEFYAIKFLSYDTDTDSFSYYRFEIDQEQKREGLKFADGSVLTSSKDKILASNQGYRIEQVSGFSKIGLKEASEVSYTVLTDVNGGNSNTIFVDAVSYPALANELSGGNTTWNIEINSAVYEDVFAFTNFDNKIVFTIPDFEGYTTGDQLIVSYRVSVVETKWFEVLESNFTGAIIDYQANSRVSGMMIGTIMIAKSNGDNIVTHTETRSSSDEALEVWLRNETGPLEENTLYMNRTDFANDLVTIQWSAKLFFGVN